MKKRPDNDTVVEHPIQKPIVVHQQLPQSRIANLRHDPPSFRESRQTGGGVESASEHANRAAGRDVGDVSEHSVKRMLR